MNWNDILEYFENHEEEIVEDFLEVHKNEYAMWKGTEEEFISSKQREFDKFIEEHLTDSWADEADRLLDMYKEGEL